MSNIKTRAGVRPTNVLVVTIQGRFLIREGRVYYFPYLRLLTFIMQYFLNFEFDGKLNLNFFFKHLFFSIFWILGILIFIFRLDIVIIEYFNNAPTWILSSIPTLYFLLLILYCVLFLKWYFILALFTYPILLLFWFIPKSILKNGKIYLFGSYINSIFLKCYNYKYTIAHFFLIIITLILFSTITDNWIKYIAVLVFSYFYFRYLYKFIKKSFQTPRFFGEEISSKIRELINKTTPENSFIVTTIVQQKDDEKLEMEERKKKQMLRSVIANSALLLITERVNSFKRKQSFIVSLLYSAIIFFLSSLFYFWFLNVQFFHINSLNFDYKGELPSFDFLYYTIKSISLGDDEIKPLTPIAKIIGMLTFGVIGIFGFIIFISVIFNIKQDKMNENVKLTTELVESQNTLLSHYFVKEFGVELNQARKEIENIDEALKNIKDLINKIF